ncbi:MAG TPA: hypothetical protein VJT81_08990 [Burkholderiales bacterium]|nr:hypothetical protein [Burkholderiales bacterium]
MALTEWQVRKDLPTRWKRLVQDGIPFTEILDGLSRGAKVLKVYRDPSRDLNSHWRAIVRLEVGIETSVLYHSGNGGYRAQCYINPTLGDKANSFAAEIMTAAVVPQLTKEPDANFLLASLRGVLTKVWIYQGAWCRRRAHEDRYLEAPRWMRELESPDKERRKLARYATLIPLEERCLELKGTFATLDGRPTKQTHKPGRSKQIHELGFT